MDKQLLREYRARYLAVSEVEAQEQRSATVASRWQQLDALYRMALGLGLLTSDHTEEEVVYQRWAKLKGA